jgi:hypothetical protein
MKWLVSAAAILVAGSAYAAEKTFYLSPGRVLFNYAIGAGKSDRCPGVTQTRVVSYNMTSSGTLDGEFLRSRTLFDELVRRLDVGKSDKTRYIVTDRDSDAVAKLIRDVGAQTGKSAALASCLPLDILPALGLSSATMRRDSRRSGSNFTLVELFGSGEFDWDATAGFPMHVFVDTKEHRIVVLTVDRGP